MTATIAIWEKALERIKPRLDPLRLDIELATYGKDGLFRNGGKPVKPSQATIDYLWLAPGITQEGFQAAAFQLVLDTKKVGVLQTYNAGLDDPFYKKASQKGIRICNSSAQGVAISEYVMAQVLSLVHPIEQQRALQAKKEWKITPFREISTTSWLIVGYGPIGQAIAKRVKAFEARTTVIRRSPSTSEFVDKSGTLADIERYLPDADIIVLACPLNATTRGMAGKAFFSAVKPGAILLNVARGGLVDDAALVAALDESRLAHAILDVFHQEPLPAESPLWSHPKIRMTSHTSFAGNGSPARWDQLFLDNIARFAKGEPLANEVDPSSLA